MDHLVVQRGLAESRQKAKAVIMAGLVEINGLVADKPGQIVSSAATVSVKKKYPPYVSRGGLKLEAALKYFSLDVSNLTVLDVGASTGGFTDCLLQHGAHKVISVDVGYGQFDWRLRHDPRVALLEKTNIRDIKPGDLEGPIHGAVIDVSFISLRIVVPVVSKLLTGTAFIIALIKPQFEVGKGQVGRGGVVRDKRQHDAVIDSLGRFFCNTGWKVAGLIPSPVIGPKGNREFLMRLAMDKPLP